MSDIDELFSIAYEEDGLEVIKQLDIKLLTKGAWSTVVFKYQDWNKAKEIYNPIKYSIRRYQKSGEIYKPRSKFNISSAKQARMLIEILQGWLDEDATVETGE